MSMDGRRRRKMWTNLVGLVVVLGIELEDSGLFGVLEVAHEVVGAKLFPPFFVLDEPVC
jgi:hypothetical protein